MKAERRVVKLADLSAPERQLYAAIIAANKAAAATRPAVPERHQREKATPKPTTRRKP